MQLKKFTTSTFKPVRVCGTIPVMNITEIWLLRSGGEEALPLLVHQQKKIARRRRRKAMAKRSHKKEQLTRRYKIFKSTVNSIYNEKGIFSYFNLTLPFHFQSLIYF